MTPMIKDKHFQHTSTTPVYIRTYPDDYAQVVGVSRKGTVIHAEYVVPGLIYKVDGSTPTLEDNIWIKFDRGYVRRKSMLGTKIYFEEYKVFDEYPVADEKTKMGDIVMIRKGALDVYGRPLPNEEYEPKTHTVAILDSSRTLALLGYPKGIQAWVYRKDLRLVQRKEDGDSIFFSNETLDLGK